MKIARKKLYQRVTSLSAAFMLVLSTATASMPFIFTQNAVAASASDVWITAAMPNPDGTDANGEYIVLKNQTTASIDISGWQIDDGESAGTLTGTIAASSTYKVCKDTDVSTSTATDCDEEWGGMSLTNSGDTITLAEGATTIDQVSYASSTSGNEVTFSSHVAPGTVSVCASGCDYTSLQDAVNAVAVGGTVNIEGDLTLGAQVTVNKSVTINGGGHMINASYVYTNNSNNSGIGIINTSNVTINNLTVEGVAGTNLHGINIYQSSGVQLTNVSSNNNDKSGVSINGSVVTVENISTSGHVFPWHGINADRDGTVLTINGTSSHNDDIDVFVDDTTLDVTVNDLNDQYDVTNYGNAAVYTLKPETPPCSSDPTTFDTFANGSVDGQYGWKSTGNYDQAIVYNTYGYTDFGCKSLRISNALTSGAFGDQTFSYETTNEAGETSAENGGLSGGTRQDHFEASWDIASTTGAYQPDLQVTVSPDRGDGARMGWIQVKDEVDGLAVNVYDYDAETDNFVYHPDVASGLDRTVPHTVKVAIDFVDGVGNDIEKIYVDGNLVHTGTTWEDYFRDQENNPTRTVDSLLFRVAGTAAPATSGNGFLVDNVNIATSNDTTRPEVSFVTPSAEGQAFAGDLNVEFQASDNVGLSSMAVNIKDSANSAHLGSCGSVSSLDGATPYTLNCTIDTTNFADGSYYLRAGATDVNGNNKTISRNVIFDNTKPNASFTSPANGDVVPGDVTVTGTATDATSDVKEVKYTVTEVSGIGGTYIGSVTNGTATYDDSTDTFEFDVNDLDNGYYRLKVQVFDNAGNHRYKYIDVYVDSTKPVVNLESPTTNAFGSDTDLVITATDDTGLDKVVANIYKDGVSGVYKSTQATVPGNATSYTHTVDLSSLPDGDYYVKYNALDTAGNLAQTKTFNFTIDDTNPQLTIDTPADESLISGTFTTEGEATDSGSGINDVRYRIREYNSDDTLGGTVVPWTSISFDATTGEWSFPVDLDDGKYRIIVRTLDEAGNGRTKRVDVMIDSTAPVITISSASKTQVSGTTEPDLTVEVFVDGVSVGTTTADGSGDWTLTFSTELSDGDYDITAKTSDAAGNDGESSVYPLIVTSPGGNTDSGTPGGNGGSSTPTNPTNQATTLDTGTDTPVVAFNQATQNPATDDDAEVLGAQTEGDEASTGTDSDNEEVLGTNTSADEKGGVWTIFGLAWYWWLLILAAISVFAWWLTRRFRTNEA